MKSYPVSVARERLADVLDAADAGETVVIERRGVQYEIRARQTPARRSRRTLITRVDAAVDAGEWTWQFGRQGLKFTSRK